MRTLAVCAAIIFGSYWAVGRALDIENAKGGGRNDVGSGVYVNGGGTYQGKTALWWSRRAVQARKDANARGRTIERLRTELRSRTIGPTLAIRLVFGQYAEQALRVAWCESRWDVNATNGQYLGLMQMGSYARSRYGHGPTALEQARAAYAYFVDTGRTWSPWECKP